MLTTNQQEIADILQTAQATKWAYSQIGDYWQALANPVHYGKSMSKWVPDYEYAHQLILDALALYVPSSGHLLDLGAGSGRVSKLVMERFPDCQVTLTDASSNMLQATSQTLAAFAGRYQVVVGDFFKAGLEFPGESFDAIVSVFAICHGRAINDYARLYADLQRWLKPGGCFVCYDHVRGATDATTLLNVAGWQEVMLQSGSKEEAQAGILSTYQEDFPLSLHQHLSLLTEAGFSGADVLYKRDIFAVYMGVKVYGAMQIVPLAPSHAADAARLQLGMMPSREFKSVEELTLALKGVDQIIIDVTEHTYRRPQDGTQQREHYSGKKHHTLKNTVIATPDKVIVFLGYIFSSHHHDYRMLKTELPLNLTGS